MSDDRSWRNIMPFGKYEGWRIRDIPDDGYLAWLLSIDLRPWLRNAVADECQRRADEYERRREEREGRTPPPAGPVIRFRAEELPLVKHAFDAGFKTLARKLHPDAGGDTREMQALNSLADSVRAQLAAIGEMPPR
jgi:hypothetical protein